MTLFKEWSISKIVRYVHWRHTDRYPMQGLANPEPMLFYRKITIMHLVKFWTLNWATIDLRWSYLTSYSRVGERAMSLIHKILYDRPCELRFQGHPQQVVHWDETLLHPLARKRMIPMGLVTLTNSGLHMVPMIEGQACDKVAKITFIQLFDANPAILPLDDLKILMEAKDGRPLLPILEQSVSNANSISKQQQTSIIHIVFWLLSLLCLC